MFVEFKKNNIAAQLESLLIHVSKSISFYATMTAIGWREMMVMKKESIIYE